MKRNAPLTATATTEAEASEPRTSVQFDRRLEHDPRFLRRVRSSLRVGRGVRWEDAELN